MSVLFSSVAPVTGEVSIVGAEPLCDGRALVGKTIGSAVLSTLLAGSVMISAVIGHYT